MTQPLTVSRAATDMSLPGDVLALLNDGMSPRDAVRTLVDARRPAMALRLQMRLLPRGYVVPWVCQCAARAALDAAETRGLAAAQAWLRDPTEANRRSALAVAASLGYVGVGGQVAACAGWAEGSLLDGEGRPHAPMPAHFMALAAAGALLDLAGVGGDFVAGCRAYIDGALDLLSPEKP